MILVHAGYRSEPGVGLAQDVVRAAKTLGSVAKAAAPYGDEPWIDLQQIAITLLPSVEGARPVALGQSVGHLDQCVEGLLQIGLYDSPWICGIHWGLRSDIPYRCRSWAWSHADG